MNYQDCLKVLASKTRTERLKGLEIKIKPVPESDRHGIPDEREAAWMRRTQNSLGKNVLIEDMTLLTREDIQGLRDAMGCENQDLSENMITSHRVIKTEYGNIPLWIYTPCGTKQRPLVVYFHGGGFFGGTTRVVENACKLLAERSEAVVISVDYVLAPEYRFPKGLLQCWETVQWAYANAGALNIDPTKIAVSGDSAGGNLAAACCLLDRKRMIKLQLLLYPAVIAESFTEYGWTEDAYEMNEDIEILKFMVNDIEDRKSVV